MSCALAKEKSIFGSVKNPSVVEPKKLTPDSRIKFACHPGVPCFTACCSSIRIVLTPYDILMLCRRLEMEPADFLEQYTLPTWLEKTDMPGVMLKLGREDEKCPFLTSEGCRVYTDRPTACRYYPVGMADFHEGGSRDADGNEKVAEEEKFFFLVKDLVMRRKSFGHQASLSEQAKRMFFMASTDLQTFRRFIFESSFLDTYELDEELVNQLKTDDVALMLFSFDYLASTLFGAGKMNIRPEKMQEKVEQLKRRQSQQVIESVAEYERMMAERG
ncbi:zinc/iron-chelating domain-containing protein [candidate division KSB3 bacterium]|nr:MAG: zinc/iron-chelating domain-containing protein [candidate division KSB3 bacterium]